MFQDDPMHVNRSYVHQCRCLVNYIMHIGPLSPGFGLSLILPADGFLTEDDRTDLLAMPEK